MFLKTLQLICVSAFALSAVISESNKGKDIISVIMMGWVTALGGGTLRDMILSTHQMFWIKDPTYFWTALFSSLFGFFLAPYLRKIKAEPLIIFFDAIGISMFSVLVTKSLLQEHYAVYVAITMGMITAIFGGVLRDILIHRPTVFTNTEYYASPVIVGCGLYVLLLRLSIPSDLAAIISIIFIICLRMYIVITKKTFPKFLLFK